MKNFGNKTLTKLGLLILSLLTTITASFPLYLTLNPVFAQTNTNSIDAKKLEADRLSELAQQQYQNGQFQDALETLQRELIIRREIGDRSGEVITLRNFSRSKKRF